MASTKPDRKLTPKQEIFCQLYTKYWEGTRAAREAGYSEKTAGIQAYQLLQNPLIQDRINQLRDHALKEVGVSRERVLLEISRVATADISQAFDEMGQMKPLKEIPEDVRRAIAGLEVHEIFDGQGGQKSAIGLARKIRLWDKNKALELLGKHMRLFADTLEHSGPNGKPIETQDKSAMTPEQINARINELLAKRGQS